MDSLSPGEKFTPAYGGHYTYERRDGASDGVHHVVAEDGKKTCFAGCAEVEIGWLPKGWLQR